MQEEQRNMMLDISKQIDRDGVLKLEIIPKEEIQVESSQKIKIEEGLQRVVNEKETVWIKLEATEEELDKIQCKADELDYAVAFSSGLLAGVVDSFLVGEWNFTEAKEESNQKINEKVAKFAKKNGYTGERLAGAVNKLEKKYKLLGDNDYSGVAEGTNTKTHHLNDLCHHPTPIGLICCLIREFNREAVYYNSAGEKHVVPLPLGVDEKGNLTGETLETKLFAGTVNWCINVARNWKGHLYSDMAGSKTTAGGGMGIPGPLLSLFKELSTLPGINDTDWPVKLKAAYTKGIGDAKGQLDLGWANVLFEGTASSKMDLRGEKAVGSLLTKQALPVLLNGVMVFAFYFFRNLVSELKEKTSVTKAKLFNCVGANDRVTLLRMFTVASGTFAAVDMLDAAIRSGFSRKQFVLRLNFVGIGAFAITVGAETGLYVKKGHLLANRKKLYMEMVNLTCAEIYYKNADNRLQLIELLEVSEQLRLSMGKEDTEKIAQDGGEIMEKAELITQVDNDIEKAEQLSGMEKKKNKFSLFNRKKEDIQARLDSVKTLQDMVKLFGDNMIELSNYMIELKAEQKKLKRRTSFTCITVVAEAIIIICLLVGLL